MEQLSFDIILWNYKLNETGLKEQITTLKADKAELQQKLDNLKKEIRKLRKTNTLIKIMTGLLAILLTWKYFLKNSL